MTKTHPGIATQIIEDEIDRWEAQAVRNLLNGHYPSSAGLQRMFLRSVAITHAEQIDQLIQGLADTNTRIALNGGGEDCPDLDDIERLQDRLIELRRAGLN